MLPLTNHLNLIMSFIDLVESLQKNPEFFQTHVNDWLQKKRTESKLLEAREKALAEKEEKLFKLEQRLFAQQKLHEAFIDGLEPLQRVAVLEAQMTVDTATQKARRIVEEGLVQVSQAQTQLTIERESFEANKRISNIISQSVEANPETLAQEKNPPT